MNMTPNDASRILARLETEFRTDYTYLEELETEWTAALDGAREFGSKYGSAPAWTALWIQQWDDVVMILRRIRALVREMERCTGEPSGDLLDAALEAWEEMQAEDVQLAAALSAIQKQVITLDAPVRADWNSLARSIESHLTKLHTCARVLRIRVELRRSNSREGVDGLVLHLLAKLPGYTPAPEILRQELQLAAVELDHEKHKSGGLMDVLKGLLMWVETPQERVRDAHALTADQAGETAAAASR